MPEILTESFCERCGTRYTFESVAPRRTRRLGQFKTLSRGVKNWVLSDDSSLDEALAAARGDEERAVTTQQLDAFHSTFNFCMSCRQYTCANCWNEAEGRCLSCAPGIVQEILQAQIPGPFAEAPVEPSRLDIGAWPQADLPGPAAPTNVWGFPDPVANGNGSNGSTNGHHELAEPTDVAGEDDLPAFDAAARLAFLTGNELPTASEDAPAADQVGSMDRAGTPEDPWRDLDERASEAAPYGEAAAAGDGEAAAATAQSLDEAAAVTAAEAFESEIEDEAAAGANRTTELLSRFRPGQNIDAELAAYEAELESRRLAEEAVDSAASSATEEAQHEGPAPALPGIDEAASSDVTATEQDHVSPVAELEVVAAGPESADVEPEPAATEQELLAAEPVLVAADVPEPVVTELADVAPAPEPEPVAAAPAEPEPELDLGAAPIADAALEPGPTADVEPGVAAEAPEWAAAPIPGDAGAEPIATADVDAPADPTTSPPQVDAAPELEPVDAAPVAASSEPVAAAPEPLANEAPLRHDQIEQPTWRIFAPEQATPPPVAPAQTPDAPAAPPAHASSEPQWPARPGVPDSPSMLLLANRARATSDAMWAASAREVVAGPGGAAPAAAVSVRPCANCGLSLSATARFCRRCGTQQG